MQTRNEYQNAINSPNKVDLEPVLKMEDYIKRSKEYEPFISPLNKDIVETYDREIAFLETLQEKNRNQEEALERSKKITNTISFDDKKRMLEEQERINKEVLSLKREKRAGYTNAVALLFVVFNLGLFFASLLLIIK